MQSCKNIVFLGAVLARARAFHLATTMGFWARMRWCVSEHVHAARYIIFYVLSAPREDATRQLKGKGNICKPTRANIKVISAHIILLCGVKRAHDVFFKWSHLCGKPKSYIILESYRNFVEKPHNLEELYYMAINIHHHCTWTFYLERTRRCWLQNFEAKGDDLLDLFY